MKKIISILLAVLVIVMSIPFAFALNHNNLILEKNKDGKYVVTNCKNFNDSYIEIPSSVNGIPVVAIGTGAFRSKSNINYVTIPDSITTIGQNAFLGCKNLTDVEFGAGVKIIGARAFNSCSSLVGIDVRNTQGIGEYAFMGCESLESFSADNGLLSIGRSAFEGCSALSFVNFGESLAIIDKLAFAGCEALTELIFPDELAIIGERAFKDCSAISDIQIGKGELDIAAYAFENCSSLTEVTIPDNVLSIGDNAFAITNNENWDVAYNVTIHCSKNAPALPYVKASNVSVYIIEDNLTITAFGDIDGNDTVDTDDAATALDIAAGIQANELSDYEVFLCDLDCNNILDTEDVILMLKKAANLS